MTRFLRWLPVFLLLGSLLILGASCSGSSVEPSIDPPTVSGASLDLTPETLSIVAGLSANLQATLTQTDATRSDVTRTASWKSSDPTVASVKAGKVTGLKIGTTTVTATASGGGANEVALTKSVTVTITAAKLESIGLTPAAPTLAMGTSQQLVATGTFTDKTKRDLSATVTWTSSAPTVASVDAKGLLTGLTAATTTVSATLEGVTGTTVATVTDATLVSLDVTPPAPSVPRGLTRQLTAMGIFSDATTQDLTAQVIWASTSTTTATVSNDAASHGLATALEAGTTIISATLGAVAGNTTFEVTAATLVSLGVTPATPSVAKGIVPQFVATGIYTDTTTQDLTAVVTWESSTPATATISNEAGSNGHAQTLAQGTSTITATLDGIADSTVLTVTAAELASIAVTPLAPSVAKGLTQQLTAVGTYTDGTTQDLTATVIWAAADPTTASVSNAAGSNGLATALALGTTVVSATSGEMTASTELTVTAAALVSLAVSPDAPAIAKGLTQQLVATGTFTDGSTQLLTDTVTWQSGTPATATISNAPGTQGLASSAATGTTVISATLGAISASTTLTVNPAALVSMTVTPANPSVAKGATVQLVATGVYTDASTADLTTFVTWQSATPATATVSNAQGSRGLVSTAAVGTSILGATLGAISSSTTVTVTAAALLSVAVAPVDASIALGGTLQLSATGTYTDGPRDVTALATWVSSTPARATVDAAGVANSVALGATSITATLGAFSASTTLTVIAVTGGHAGPQYPGWTQCVGYRDVANQDDIPNSGWADSCKVGTKLRLACGANAGSVRSIDIGRNVFVTGLNGYPEVGLITAASFALPANDIYAGGNQPNSSVSWWVNGNGCDESSSSLTINNGCSWEASNCFGQGLAGDRFLYVYTAP